MQVAVVTALAVFILLLPQRSFADSPLFRTRIYCQSSASYGAHLTSFLSDGSVSPRELAVQAPDLQPLQVSEFFPIWSNGNQGESLVVAADPIHPNQSGVLLATLDLKKGMAATERIVNFPSDLEGLNSRHGGASVGLDETNSLVIVPNVTGSEYNWVDLRTHTTLRSLPVSPRQWAGKPGAIGVVGCGSISRPRTSPFRIF